MKLSDLFCRKSAARIAELEAANAQAKAYVNRVLAEIAAARKAAADAEAAKAVLEERIVGLTATAAAVEKLAGLSEDVTAAGDAIRALASAIADGNKGIANAIGSLALATERGARAKQSEVEFNKAQVSTNGG